MRSGVARRGAQLSLTEHAYRKAKRTVKLGAYGTSHPRGARLALLHALTPAA
jgi:hypothetical protein